ncbi:hypothetical protein N9Y17_02720 [Gammaproteobacteria bacterium]|nr:hypothetical protein [Gammaproteobacteria bacterium]
MKRKSRKIYEKIFISALAISIQGSAIADDTDVLKSILDKISSTQTNNANPKVGDWFGKWYQLTKLLWNPDNPTTTQSSSYPSFDQLTDKSLLKDLMLPTITGSSSATNQQDNDLASIAQCTQRTLLSSQPSASEACSQVASNENLQKIANIIKAQTNDLSQLKICQADNQGSSSSQSLSTNSLQTDLQKNMKVKCSANLALALMQKINQNYQLGLDNLPQGNNDEDASNAMTMIPTAITLLQNQIDSNQQNFANQLSSKLQTQSFENLDVIELINQFDNGQQMSSLFTDIAKNYQLDKPLVATLTVESDKAVGGNGTDKLSNLASDELQAKVLAYRKSLLPQIQKQQDNYEKQVAAYNNLRATAMSVLNELSDQRKATSDNQPSFMQQLSDVSAKRFNTNEKNYHCDSGLCDFTTFIDQAPPISVMRESAKIQAEMNVQLFRNYLQQQKLLFMSALAQLKETENVATKLDGLRTQLQQNIENYAAGGDKNQSAADVTTPQMPTQ